MGLSYKVDTLPATLRAGEFAVVDGVVYVGNSANEPVQVGSSTPEILTELPEADVSKAGQQFWYNGALWTYAQDGQFGSLLEGTPWPAKGYKEAELILWWSNISGVKVHEIKNEIGDEVSEGNWIRVEEGIYQTNKNDYDIDKVATQSSVRVHDTPVYLSNSGVASYIWDGANITVVTTDFSGANTEIGNGIGLGVNLSIKIYP